MIETLKRVFQVLTGQSPPEEVTWVMDNRDTYYLLDSMGLVKVRVWRGNGEFWSVRFTCGAWLEEIYGLDKAVKYAESKTKDYKITNAFPGDLS